MPVLNTIRSFILITALVISLVLCTGLYFAASHIYDAAVKGDALASSEQLAQDTFESMARTMRQGWTRTQVQDFIRSVENDADRAGYSITIHRGDPVTQLYGPIEQPPADEGIQSAFRQGTPRSEGTDYGIRYLYPLTARAECLGCHSNVTPGEVLGIIEVKQELAPLIGQINAELAPLMARAKDNLLLPLLFILPMPFLAALGVALILHKRVNGSLAFLQRKIDGINKVSDLRDIQSVPQDLGFRELNEIIDRVNALSQKLRTVAVDKELLEFEIRLLERFVITSEVVRDWRGSVSRLLVEIDQLLPVHTLFSVFRVTEDLFELEVFWLSPPGDGAKTTMERLIEKALKDDPKFGTMPRLKVSHNAAEPQMPPIELDDLDIGLQTKSLSMDPPAVGGLVGLSAPAECIRDETRMLVTESILSTLLNVIGSVKAIDRYTKDLEYYANRDPLTNLYNQRLFWEMLENEIKRAERHLYPTAVLVLDLDNFKSVNDTYGHSFGDRLLQTFADIVQGALRNCDVLARYGGDEFVAILPETDAAEAEAIARRILERVRDLALDSPTGQPVRPTTSIGISVYPDHAVDIKDLFMFADNMMYKAKAEGKNRTCLPTENEVVEIFRSIGEKSLFITHAIEQKRVVPYFQPILDVRDNSVAAVEVLSRIGLEDGSVINAHEFIEIAERMSLIHRLDEVMMEKTFQQVREVNYAGLIFLNLSLRALVPAEFIATVKRLTTQYAIAPEQVVFEITERDTVKNFAMLEQFVNELKLANFKLAIDDFGSGFSSFHYLKRLPIDFVKIEGEFVVNMAQNPRDAALVNSIAALAQELGIQALAEFVESEEVLEHVARAGIAFAQGYHIGRPTPRLLADRDTARVRA